MSKADFLHLIICCSKFVLISCLIVPRIFRKLSSNYIIMIPGNVICNFICLSQHQFQMWTLSLYAERIKLVSILLQLMTIISQNQWEKCHVLAFYLFCVRNQSVESLWSCFIRELLCLCSCIVDGIRKISVINFALTQTYGWLSKVVLRLL